MLYVFKTQKDSEKFTKCYKGEPSLQKHLKHRKSFSVKGGGGGALLPQPHQA